MPAFDRSHYDRQYKVRAKRVRDAAYADPGTRCWSCGLTLAEARAMEPLRGITWDAGHTVDGDNYSPLRAEHSSCNRSRGATAGNQRRATSGGTGRV